VKEFFDLTFRFGDIWSSGTNLPYLVQERIFTAIPSPPT
jgi:hypothetical protein